MKDYGECCPVFNPEPWDEKEIVWKDKLFVQDRVRSLFHIPLNFGKVVTKNCVLIEKSNAMMDDMIVLADENSLWGADVFMDCKTEVAGAKMTKISGTFQCKVFEGPYKNMKNWIAEMNNYLDSKDKTCQKLYFYYTTCPKCAKKHGKNYVVLIAKTGS